MHGSAKGLGTTYCFVAGTLVTTSDGFKPIEEIQVGDEVLAENEKTGEIAVKKVLATSVNETDEFINVYANGEKIVATPCHPFYVYKHGWTLAGSLRAGDVLVLSNGEYVTVEWVQHEILESPVKVYNFDVEDFHTYFVGKSGILVHNAKGKCKEITDSVQPFEVTTYKDFTDRSLTNDKIAGHELWQHANIKEKGLATTRLSTDASKNNIVMALPDEIHVDINRAQKAFDAKSQDPLQNIFHNAKIMYEHPKIPNEKVDEMLEKTLDHLYKTIKY